MGKNALGWVVLAGGAVAAAFALAARRRGQEHGDVLLLTDVDRRRAEATARYYNEVGDSHSA